MWGIERLPLVDCERLSGAVSEMGVFYILISPDIREDLVTRRGLVSKLMICCTNTACNKKGVISDPYASDTKSLNARSALGSKLVEGKPV